MLEIIFGILMIIVFGKLILLAIKLAWGITKIFFTIIFLPLILIGLFFTGLSIIAIPAVIVIGIISLFLNN